MIEYGSVAKSFYAYVTPAFEERAAASDLNVIYTSADRHGVWEWACGGERDKREIYVFLACYPMSPGGGRFELAAGGRNSKTGFRGRQLVAASRSLAFEAIDVWLWDHWDDAERVAERLEPESDYFPDLLTRGDP